MRNFPLLFVSNCLFRLILLEISMDYYGMISPDFSFTLMRYAFRFHSQTTSHRHTALSSCLFFLTILRPFQVIASWQQSLINILSPMTLSKWHSSIYATSHFVRTSYVARNPRQQCWTRFWFWYSFTYIYKNIIS